MFAPALHRILTIDGPPGESLEELADRKRREVAAKVVELRARLKAERGTAQQEKRDAEYRFGQEAARGVREELDTVLQEQGNGGILHKFNAIQSGLRLLTADNEDGLRVGLQYRFVTIAEGPRMFSRKIREASSRQSSNQKAAMDLRSRL